MGGLFFAIVFGILKERGYAMLPEAATRLQQRIDELDRRMRMDSNDLDYETHLRQKRELQSVLDRIKKRQGINRERQVP